MGRNHILTSASSFAYTYKETENGSIASQNYSGTYTYNAPKVTGKITISGKTSILEGTIEGNTLTVSMDGQYDETYTKK